MALVTIVGYPCSGKSRIAEALVEDFRGRLADPSYTGPKLEVVHVSDENSHVPRSVYDSELHRSPVSLLKIDPTIINTDGRQYIREEWTREPVHECDEVFRAREDSHQ